MTLAQHSTQAAAEPADGAAGRSEAELEALTQALAKAGKLAL